MSTDSFQPPGTADQQQVAGPQHQPRGRGTYVQQACGVCRAKKVRCDGVRPVCTTCETSNRASECSWSKDSTPLRKNRTEAYFESLKKRLNASEEYNAYLLKELERCRREHGGPSNGLDLAHRPPTLDTSLDDVDPTDYGDTEDRDNEPSHAIHDLIAPIQRLRLDGSGGLISYGSTSVFGFRPMPTRQLNVPSRFPAVVENPDDTYVLLLDGVDESHYNPNLEWSRHLPTTVPLDRRAHDKALDLFFKFLASWCLRVVFPLFLRDMYRALSTPETHTPPKTTHYSPMLHNAIIALALSFSDDPAVRDYKARQAFANEAKKYIEAEVSKPNLCTVTALAILGTYHSSQGDQTLGFMYFGMSARVSQALGLDVDSADWVKLGLIEPTEVLDRDWTWWTTFAQDVNWSLYVGRDFCVRAPSQTDFREMPIPYVDSELDKLPFHHPPSGIPPQPNYLSKTFASTCELLVIARRIMTVVNGINEPRVHPAVIDKLIADIDLELNTWKSTLPPEVDMTQKNKMTATPHKLMVHMAYWWQFILLHRPYFHKSPKVIHSSDKAIDHSKLCKRSAEHIMDLLAVWRQLYTLRYCPVTIVQPLFAAGTIFLLSGVQATSGIRVAQKELKHSIDSLKLLIQYLKEIGKSWQSAYNIESLLKALVEDQLKPAIQKRQGSVVPKDRGPSESSERIQSYVTNPPSRRPSQTGGSRKSRPRQSSNPTSNGARARSIQADRKAPSASDSPTIAVHPALESSDSGGMMDVSFQNGFQQPQSESPQDLTSLLGPSWASGSPGSSSSPSGSTPIQIARPRSSSAGGPQRSAPSASSSPISIRAPPSPALSVGSRMRAPSPGSSLPFFTDPTSSSFPSTAMGGNANNMFHQQQPQSPLATFATGTPLTSSLSMDQDALFGVINSLDVGSDSSSSINHFDYSNFEMSRYLAMPSGQNLSGVPFVGPFTIGESVGSLQQSDRQHHYHHHHQQSQGAVQTPVSANTSPEGSFDFSSIFDGMGTSGMDGGGGLGMGGFYGVGGGSQGFLSGGSPIMGGHLAHRRAVSEDARHVRMGGGAGGYGDARMHYQDFNNGF